MLPKCPTGILGFDEITEGGLPVGRPSLVCGSAGCGKTLFAIEFLVNGAVKYGDPGVFVSFEETKEELTQNVTSLGFDLDDLAERNLVAIDYVRVERSEIEETGEYDLEGLFIRLGHAIDSIGAKRVVLDTIESLFSGLLNTGILRAELRRLFGWLKTKGVTAIITGERGEGTLTRHGLEEYVSDCVILLDHRVNEQMSTRRLRIVKYRGSTHGTNEYPFLIDNDGISVMPITSLGLDHPVTSERVSTGIPQLDVMMGGKGYYCGSSILVSGQAGTGKSSVAAHFVSAACSRGEVCLYFAFEESRDQVIRNMKSIGLDLDNWIQSGKLHFDANRPTSYGMEMHLAIMHKRILEVRPAIVVVDPISPFISVGSREEVRAMLMRLVGYLKAEQITTLCTNLIGSGPEAEAVQSNVSSVMDTVLLLRDIEMASERNRGLLIVKSRGMPHSNQIREFVIDSNGINLLDVYVGPEGALTGSARIAREADDKMVSTSRMKSIERMRLLAQRKREALEAEMAVLQLQIDADDEDLVAELEEERARGIRIQQSRAGIENGSDAGSSGAADE